MAVIKVAKRGFDARTTGDENLLYSNLWPMLPIAKQGEFTVNAGADSVVTTHELGYPAAFWVFTNNGTTNINRRSNTSELALLRPFAINDKELVFKTDGDSGSLHGYYYIFALDLTKKFEAPITKTGGQEGSGQPVFRLARPGKSTNDRLVDQAISTEARSFLIHSVTPGKVEEDYQGGKAFRVPHALGYVPVAIAYSLDNGYYYTNGTTLDFYGTDSEVIFTEATGGREMTTIIFKDPFEITSSALVTI